MTADLDEFALAKLAREMAMNIRPYKAVFEDFNISEEDYYEIAKNEFYIRAKEQFALEWNSALSVNERVKLIRSLHMRKARRETGLFVAEGASLLVTARDAGWKPRMLVFLAGSARPHEPSRCRRVGECSSFRSAVTVAGASLCP